MCFLLISTTVNQRCCFHYLFVIQLDPQYHLRSLTETNLDKEAHTIDHLLYKLYLRLPETVSIGDVKHTINTGSINTTCIKREFITQILLLYLEWVILQLHKVQWKRGRMRKSLYRPLPMFCKTSVLRRNHTVESGY